MIILSSFAATAIIVLSITAECVPLAADTKIIIGGSERVAGTTAGQSPGDAAVIFCRLYDAKPLERCIESVTALLAQRLIGLHGVASVETAVDGVPEIISTTPGEDPTR